MVSAVLLAVGITLLPSDAGARETYAAYVARVTAQVPEGAAYRDDLEAVILRAANSYRSSKGLPPLAQAQPELVAAARAHAVDMMQNDFVGHTSSSGAGFESRMRALNPGKMLLPLMAENAARERSKGPPNHAKAERVFQQWVKSAAHAKTLRSRDYIAVATGVVETDGKLFAVQIFTGPDVKSNIFGTGGNASVPKLESGEGIY